MLESPELLIGLCEKPNSAPGGGAEAMSRAEGLKAARREASFSAPSCVFCVKVGDKGNMKRCL